MEDLGAPVVKGDEKSGPDAAKKIKKDTSIPTAVKGDEAPQKLKEEDESDEMMRTRTMRKKWTKWNMTKRKNQ